MKLIKIALILFISISTSMAKDLLIVDTSGSLSANEKEVRSVTHKYLQTNQDVLAFADQPYFIKDESELEFGGGTALSLALERVKTLDVDYLTIISDGVPNNEEEAIRIAKTLKDTGIKICGIYISDTLTVPDTFKIIADRTFAINEIHKALEYCDDSVREELLGTQAQHKVVDGDKYVF